MGPHMGSTQLRPLSSSRVMSSRLRSLLVISFLRMVDSFVVRWIRLPPEWMLPHRVRTIYAPGAFFTIGAALKLSSDNGSGRCQTGTAIGISARLMHKKIPLGPPFA